MSNFKSCYCFDIDGTLADGSHRQHLVKNKPKNWVEYWKLAHLDKPIYPVSTVLLNLYQQKHKIFIASGRSEKERELTTKWLINECYIDTRHDDAIPFEDRITMYMRPANDYREDSIIKDEILARIRADGYEPIGVFDDRPRVIKMWREKGLFVFNCDQTALGEDF